MLFRNVYKYFLSIKRIPQRLSVVCRSFCDFKEIDLSKSHTVVLKNGVIACWHPEKSFPYEHSKPIAAEELQSVSQNSNILSKETKRIAELRGSLARTGPSNHMLREIFYTGKHEWYTRYREERLRSVAAPDPKRR